MDTISVIIPIQRAGEELSGLLKSLRGQSASCEIVIVDIGGALDPAAYSLRGVSVVRPAEGVAGHGAARNAGWRAASGAVVVYLTEDALPARKDSIERLAACFENPRVGAAFGRQLPKPGASPFGAHARLFNYPPEPRMATLADRKRLGIKTAFISNSFAAYRRDLLEAIGGFDEAVIMGEDVCAGGRILMKGFAIAYAADAGVYHSHDYSVVQEFRRYFDIGVLHATARWLTENFGAAEGEGLRYLKSELRFLAGNGKYLRLPEFCVRNAMKYAGYILGKLHDALPAAVSRGLSMHPQWWKGGKGGT